MSDKNTNDDNVYLGADGIPVLNTPVEYDTTGTSAPGTVIGDYRLIREIGRGSTATVHLCENVHSGKEYALKKLQKGVVTDWHRKMLENEARLSGRLEHKNIASIYTADPDQGYIVMEYVDGKSLDHFSSKDTLLPVEIVVKVIKEVAEALNYSSRKNIFHLDIKPGNIIVSHDFSRVKVMDFGCASIDGKRDDMLLIAGSVNYMAPEQLTEGGKVDARADIYSLGAVFYRLVTGQVTYRTKRKDFSLLNVIRLVTSKPHTPVLAYRHDVDSDVVAIIDKMLVKSPESRYASWVDVILDLAKLSADLAKPVVAPPKRPTESAKRPAHIEQSKIDLIGACPLFAGLAEADLYELILNSGFRKVERYETLTSDGENGDMFFVILQGGVNIFKNGDILREFHPGETVGEEVCCSESSRYCFGARATQETSVLAIQKSMKRLLGNTVLDRLNEALLKSMNIKLLRFDEYSRKGR